MGSYEADVKVVTVSKLSFTPDCICHPILHNHPEARVIELIKDSQSTSHVFIQGHPATTSVNDRAAFASRRSVLGHNLMKGISDLGVHQVE